MSNQNLHNSNIIEDEIDLKELFNILLKYKKYILIFTLVSTILSVFYTLNLPKIYEVKTNIQIGIIKNNKDLLIEEAKPLIEKLKIENRSNNNYPLFNSISIIKGTKDILKLSIYGLNNQSTIKKSKDIINKIIHDHQIKIDTFINLTMIRIDNNKVRLRQIKNDKSSFQKQISDLNKNISKLGKIDIAFTTLYQMQINEITKNILELNTQMFELEAEIDKLKVSINASNIRPTQIIGDLEFSELPIKPNKKLIILGTLTISLIISIFGIIFLELLRGVLEIPCQSDKIGITRIDNGRTM